MATAVQVESLWNGITDTSGNALTGGKVFTYSAGTTTPVALFTASDKSAQATNPIILDSSGKAQVYADGRYKFVIKTAADATLYTLDNLLYGFDDSRVLWGGLSTGSANTQAVSVPDILASYSNGQRISFVAGYANTGAMTLNINSLGAVSIVKGASNTPLASGDIVAGQLVSCTYYGGAFKLDGDLYPAATMNINYGGYIPINVGAGSAAAPAYCAGNDVNTGMFSPAADTIAWATNGVERARLNNLGRLLIGRTTELGASERILIGPSTGQNWATVDGGNTNANDGSAFIVATGGVNRAAFGVYSAIVGGAADATATLYSSGAGYKVLNIQAGVGTWPMKWNASTGAWTYDTSRRSVKENIRDSIYGLAAVKQLQPRQFNYLESEQFREDVGFIADEVYTVIPELAPTDEAGEPAGVSYDRLTAVLCKAIQELAAKVEALEAQLA